MYDVIWHILDWFFLLFHAALILFNLFGWIFRGTRRWNLVVLLLTAASWFGLGIFYGWGYCFLTDWHWQVLEHLSNTPHEHGYVQYLFRRFAGVSVGAKFADWLTIILFFLALAISLVVNFRDMARKKRGRSKLS